MDRQACRVVRTVAKGYLDLDLNYLGSIPRDEAIPKSVDQMTPLMLSYPNSRPASSIKAVVQGMLKAMSIGKAREHLRV